MCIYIYREREIFAGIFNKFGIDIINDELLEIRWEHMGKIKRWERKKRKKEKILLNCSIFCLLYYYYYYPYIFLTFSNFETSIKILKVY